MEQNNAKNQKESRRKLSHKSSKINKDLEDKYLELKEREESLDSEIEELISKGVNINLEPQMKALHDYNEMKDLTQMVLGYLANAEHTTVAELHSRYNLPLD